jgi:hypothetical protein
MKTRLVLVVAVVVGALPACEMLVDTSVVQCDTNGDCATLGGAMARAVCGPQKVCVKGPECTTNMECTTASQQPSICRKSDQKCAILTTAQCGLKADPADVGNDDTLWFGLITPRMANMNSGLHMEAAADLVRQQFNQNGKLPPATINGPRRGFAFVSCNNDADLDKSINHLMNEVQVPAIVGSNLSSDVVTMLTSYTVKTGVLTLSPTAGAANITDIDNKGLFFRMSGSDTIAVKTLAYVLKTVIEPQLRSGATPTLGPGEPMRVAVLYKSDALGESDNRAATEFVVFNGKSTRDNGSNYKAIPYGSNPNDPLMAARFTQAVGDVIAFKPHVIFGLGSTEFSALDVPIEKTWPPGVPRPYWLVVKGIATNFIKDIGGNEDWAKRVYGAQPFVDKSPPAYQFFEQSFIDNYPDLRKLASVTATPSYFDAAYVLAYAIAANGNNPLTGANLASAIRTRLTPAPSATSVYVGADHIFEVLRALNNGQSVDLQGLTGSLDFDLHGDVPQTQEVFCMRNEPPPGGGFGTVTGVKSAGMRYDPVSDAVTGNITACPGP